MIPAVAEAPAVPGALRWYVAAAGDAEHPAAVGEQPAGGVDEAHPQIVVVLAGPGHGLTT